MANRRHTPLFALWLTFDWQLICLFSCSSVELIALLAISCTFFLFMHTNKLNSRLKEMEVKLQPSEFSALGLTGNHISGHDAGSKSLSPSFRYRYPLPPATTISRTYLTHRTAPHLISSWRISSHPIHLPSRNNGHKARLWARSCARLHSRCVAYRNRASDLDRKLCARSDKNGG